MKKLSLLSLGVLVLVNAASAADLPIIYSKTYEVKDASEAFVKFQESRVHAEIYFKTDNIQYREKYNKRGETWILTYTWSKR